MRWNPWHHWTNIDPDTREFVLDVAGCVLTLAIAAVGIAWRP